MFDARPHPPVGTDALARMSWHTFEHLLAEYYREQGWRVEYDSRPKSLKALGASLDLRMRRGNEVTILQCRQWDATEVQVQDVNELLATMLNEGASGGILVTRGTFSGDARTVQLRQPRLQLIDGDVLRVMLKLDGPATGVTSHVAASERPARKEKPARAPAPRHDRPWLVPSIVAAVVVCLLGLFVWRAMTRVTAPPPPVAATPAAPPAAPAPAATTPPVAATRPRNDLPSPTLSRELAERARLQESRSEASRHGTQRQAEDAMKVMERNTRELGSAE
ncbi:Restriction endonuclease [Luteibacter sp. UNC138MFCol5.1]|nr:Restriction endonuclease [Luteibacter sp. UNC138MFCol5.1]